MSFSKPFRGSVKYIGRFLDHAVFRVLSANRRAPGRLQVIGERGAARSIEQRLQVCVSSNAGSEAVAIGLAKPIDASVATLLTDLRAVIALAIVEAEASAASLQAFFAGPSCSLIRHGTLQSNSSEPEPYSQTGVLLNPAQS